MELSAIRKEYMRGGLSRRDVSAQPLALFDKWLREAIGAGIPEPTAMVVATVSAGCHPSSRTVLLKGVENGKLLFFSNYGSRKGEQIEANPHISLTFPWYGLERQVHVEGTVAKVSAGRSDAYFDSRPRSSRIGAVVSQQSRPIESSEALERAFAEAEAFYAGQEPERPAWWGGYAVTPLRMEFWQGRENRLHDRLLYTRLPEGLWRLERLAP